MVSDFDSRSYYPRVMSSDSRIKVTTTQRLILKVQGAVQGVGFRPFIYRLAQDLHLQGWIQNTSQGVVIEVEGHIENVQAFQQRWHREKPTMAYIESSQETLEFPMGYLSFEIRASSQLGGGAKSVSVLPDLAICLACLAEIYNPENRRYHYPFTNCTHCGPRFTFIQGLPYDRPLTTMRGFELCSACQAEYENPTDRRFHAQPIACPACGPHLELWDATGEVLSKFDQALTQAADSIRGGQVLALQGLGGFHLMVDARNNTAVQTLRQRKQRPDKPFAVMYPSLETLKLDCIVTDQEADLLTSPQAPIVLVARHFAPNNSRHSPCTAVAPGFSTLGVMLPYTPLHHLLLQELEFPIVATSGNGSDEPICIDPQIALKNLTTLADRFLVHNRPIARSVDDSIVQIQANKPVILRRARGYAPTPVAYYSIETDRNVLAVGSHLKNTIALAFEGRIILSHHLGDLTTLAAFQNFQQTVTSLSDLYGFQPDVIACDAHPDYQSSHYAAKLSQQLQIPLVKVQHHLAHVLATMAEKTLDPPCLGIAWDGSGWGSIGGVVTLWGGECLAVNETNWQRIYHFDPFPLPGAERAIKQPCRSALGVLWVLLGDTLWDLNFLPTIQSFTQQDQAILTKQLRRALNCPLTSSVGRLFDAVASLIGVQQVCTFEGQAAMRLEALAHTITTDNSYPFTIASTIGWQPMVLAILEDIKAGVPPAQISAQFHNTLAEIIVTMAQQQQQTQIILTGGCFQNRYLLEHSSRRLQAAGMGALWPQKSPPNDGGIAVGQALAALKQLPPDPTL